MRLSFFLSIFGVIVSCLVDSLLPGDCCHDARWVIAEHEVVSFLRDRNKLVLCDTKSYCKYWNSVLEIPPAQQCL